MVERLPIYQPDTGIITIDGLRTSDNAKEIRKKIGVLFGGDVFLYDLLTARENIMYFALLQGIEENMAKERIDYFVKLFHMEDYIDCKVEKFSRGMKQKVAFTRILIHNPSILLLDEPSTGLDIEAISTVRSFLHQCKERKMTILLSTHNTDEINLCDDFIFLKNGSVVSKGKIEKIKSEKALKSLFGI